MDTPQIVLKPGREKSLIRRHPWVFSGAVADINGSPELGETIDVLDAGGNFLGRAAYSPNSQIRARVWTWNPEEPIDEKFFRSRLQRAFAARQSYFLDRSLHLKEGELQPALRLVHGESDGLPGLLLDGYGDILVLESLSAGTERWLEPLADLIMEMTGAASLYERSDVDVRRLEGLPERSGLLRGEQPPERFEISDGHLHYWVDVRGGHKTGFYLDQRFNRAIVGRLAQRRDVLDCFAYTGGFTAHALANGASSVLAVDSSGDALALARENLSLNQLPLERVEWLEGDVFHVLRSFRDARRSFDMIVLDPPKFAQTAAQAERAARGYKDINLLAFKLLRPGGLLATFSCSGGVSPDLFQKIVAGAALDANVHALILERLFQAPDHPVALNFPEGEYLKGFVIRVE